MTRFATLALGVALLVACAPDRERLLDEAFHDLEASALSGTPQPVSLAVSPDGRVAFGGGYNALWVQDARGSGGRYESIPGAYVTFVGETLFVGGSANNATTGAFFRSSDGWATLQPAGQTPLAVQHISADEARVAVTGGTEVWVLDRERFLAGAGEDEADLVLRWSLDGPTWWEGSLVATALRGDVLWLAAGDGVRALDLSVDPPAVLYWLAEHDPHQLVLEGDRLLVGQNDTGGAYDVGDPRAPRPVGPFPGGEAFDVGAGALFGVDDVLLTVSSLGEPGEAPVPVKQVALEACEAVAALVDRVLVTCDDQGTFELGPIAP